MNASRQLPVPDALSRWVDRIDLVSYRADDRSCPLVHLPDAATAVVWRTVADGCSALFVVGPRTHAVYYDSKDVPACARFQLAPGAGRMLLDTPINELTDQVVSLNELWGPPGDELADQLTALASQPITAVKHIASALAVRARAVPAQERTTADLIRHASIDLSPEDGQPHPRVNELARRLGISERHLRSVFTTTVGIPPKQFARVSRIRAILPRLGREPWARLAANAGYYDQAHMSAHFREVMKVTPTEFSDGRLPIVSC